MVYVVFCIGFPGYPTGLIQTPTATPGERQVSPAIYADIGATTSPMATNALQIQRSEPSPLPVSNSPLARVGEQLLTAQRTGTLIHISQEDKQLNGRADKLAEI